MNKNLRIVLAGLLSTAVVLAPVVSLAQDTPKTPGNAEAKPPAGPKAIPFRGTVAAVDQNARTVKVGERVFHIGSDTKLIKENQPGVIGDIKVGDAISGNYTTGDDGKLTAKMMRFGAKPAASAEKAPKNPKAADKQPD
jgi:hypothetical protein